MKNIADPMWAYQNNGENAWCNVSCFFCEGDRSTWVTNINMIGHDRLSSSHSYVHIVWITIGHLSLGINLEDVKNQIKRKYFSRKNKYFSKIIKHKAQVIGRYG